MPWHPALTALVAALVGGAAGGALVRATGPAPAKPAVARASAERATLDDDGDLVARVETLERAVAGLDRQRRALQAARAYGSVMTSGNGVDGAAPAAVVDDPVFEAAVRDIVDQARAERNTEKEARRDDRRKRGAARFAARLGEELSLSPDQEQRVTQAMADLFKELRALRDSDGGSSEWRGMRGEMRKRAQSKLEPILSADQMQKYRALEESGEFGFGRGGRGRRGGRGDGDED